MKNWIIKKLYAGLGYKTRVLLLVCILAPASLWAQLFEFSGKVVRVTDGDTISVLHLYEGQKIERKVRLWGIDCPERKAQPFGAAAKREASQLAFGKQVTVHVKDIDHYGRLVARVELPGGKDLGLALAQKGLAWWYEKFAPQARDIEQSVKKAKAAKKGLWSRAEAVAPWHWRQLKRLLKKKKKKNGRF